MRDAPFRAGHEAHAYEIGTRLDGGPRRLGASRAAYLDEERVGGRRRGCGVRAGAELMNEDARVGRPHDSLAY